jgi:tetratricopeptide (TPR) repeat protein
MSVGAAGGAIVTFYSYKGGVGRTMALANAAVQLSRKGNRVLMVDWDLEAPGLINYFISEDAQHKANVSVTHAEDEGGLLALLKEGYDCANGVVESSAWRRKITNLKIPPDAPTWSNPTPPTPGTLDLLASGYGRKDYSTILADFSWKEFFARQRGGEWLEALRKDWSKSYDFILIDSRTGLTDSGGVCTVQMPDFLVLVFTANDQSLKNGLKVVAAVQEARQSFVFERGPLAVVPLLSRWDGKTEVDLADVWIQRLSDQIGVLTSLWLPKVFSPRDFLEKTRIPHVARFSFGEPLPALTHSLTDPDLPGLSYDSLARLLHAKLSNAGSIIDPSYTPPPITPDTIRDNEPALLALVSDKFALNREIEQLSQTHGETSQELASFLRRASAMLCDWGRFSEADPLARRALAIDEASFGPDHPEVATDLTNLAQLLRAANRLAEAEPMYRRALAINEASFGQNHPNVTRDLNNLASLLYATNRLSEAEQLYRHALAITETSFGRDHPNVAIRLNNLASLLQDTHRLSEAEQMYRHALAITKASFGRDHPNVASGLNNLALLLQDTNRLSEAEPLIRRALAISEASFGPDHPDVARDLNNLALLLQDSNRLAEAEPMYRRALAITEASFGADHPKVASGLNNLALLLLVMNRRAEAEPLKCRALAIDEATTRAYIPPDIRALLPPPEQKQ